MQHIAVMKSSWKLLQKILSGKKTIESRWYKSKKAPWNTVGKGDTVFFKDSGKPVTAKAQVEKVLQFQELNERKVMEIVQEYAKEIGIEKTEEFFHTVKDKKYCILVFLKNPEKVEEFEIDKKGFGLMNAWLTMEDAEKIKKRNKSVY